MEWIIEKSKYPIQITYFLNSVFEIYEIRGRVGQHNGIKFIVHTNEKNHSVPHIHAQYGAYQVEIALDDFRVLAGNLPKKNLKAAQKRVEQNKDKLLNDWNNIAISAISSMTMTKLDWKE